MQEGHVHDLSDDDKAKLIQIYRDLLYGINPPPTSQLPKGVEDGSSSPDFTISRCGGVVERPRTVKLLRSIADERAMATFLMAMARLGHTGLAPMMDPAVTEEALVSAASDVRVEVNLIPSSRRIGKETEIAPGIFLER